MLSDERNAALAGNGQPPFRQPLSRWNLLFSFSPPLPSAASPAVFFRTCRPCRGRAHEASRTPHCATLVRGESFFRNFQKPYLSATSRNTAKLRSRPKMRAAASRMQAPACLNVRVSEPKCERSEPNLQRLPYLQQPLLQLLQPHNHLLF